MATVESKIISPAARKTMAAMETADRGEWICHETLEEFVQAMETL